MVCSAGMSHLRALGGAHPLWRKKRQIDKLDSSSCTEEAFGSAHGFCNNAIADVEFLYPSET